MRDILGQMTPRCNASSARAALPALAALLLLALAASGSFAFAGPRAAATPSIGELAWLQGVWLTQAEDGSFEEETWSAPRGGGMVGMFRMVGPDGVATLYELMTISLEGPDGPAPPAASGDGPIIPGQERGTPLRLRLRLRHFDRGLTPWKSEANGPLIYEVKELTEQSVRFEDPARDFPREIVYRREGDRLAVRLVSAAAGQEDLSFEFRRASAD